MTFCKGIDCPIKNSCRRYNPNFLGIRSEFIDTPYKWFDNGTYFYCQEYWNNKPLKKYTMEQVKQELNVKKT